MATAKKKTAPKTRKTPTGRKSKLHDPEVGAEIREAIAQKIRSGTPKRYAAESSGVPESTFYRWLEEGEKDKKADVKSCYAEFWEAIRKAETVLILKNIKVIDEAANDGSWQASAWKLERMFPSEFGRQAMDLRAELVGKDDGPIKTESAVQVYIPDNGREKKEGK